MSSLNLSLTSADTSLSVRRFSVREALSSPFALTVWARSPDPSLDLAALVGKGAAFRAECGYAFARDGARLWTGVVAKAQQIQAEPTGLSTYLFRIVPNLWLLTQRRGHRVFQHLAVPDLIDRLLAEWQIRPTWDIDRAAYPKLDYKVQYGESDYAFFCRLLEEAGIAFAFADDGDASALVLSDRLQAAAPRPGEPLPFVDNPNQAAQREYVTAVRLGDEVRPGAAVLRDFDVRNPSFPLFAEAPHAPDPERRLERYDYRPGGFLAETGQPGHTPVADDRGAARHDPDHGRTLAQRALEAERTGKRCLGFQTNAFDLRPGTVFSMRGHPHDDLPDGRGLLVTSLSLTGSVDGEWDASGQAVLADVPYRPSQTTPRPRAHGVQVGTIVGPAGEEIHTDELGRVRVQLPWDREGRMNDESSCWMRVNQGLGGSGYGLINIPRVGQEVLVSFLEGDPEQPVVVGRLFNMTSPVPHLLPAQATVSGWKSTTSPGGSGFNEIKLDDVKGEELFSTQAEKNLRRLVNEDETTTTEQHTRKQVGGDETETTLGRRVEVTRGKRAEMTSGGRRGWLKANAGKLVKGSFAARYASGRAALVGADQNVAIRGARRDRVEGDTHALVKGGLRERIDGKASALIAQSRDEQIGGSMVVSAGLQIHLEAVKKLVLSGADVTLKAGGGFVRFDGGGVTIRGTFVKINVDGSPRTGKVSKPDMPDDAKEPAFSAASGVGGPGAASGATSGATSGTAAPGGPADPGSPAAPVVPGSTAAQPSAFGVPEGAVNCRGNMLVKQETGMSCAVAASRMVIQSRTGQDIPEEQLRNESAARGHPPGYDPINGTYCSDVNTMLTDHGVTGVGGWGVANTVGAMQAALAQGQPAMLLLRDVGHFVVLDGIETRPDGTQALLIRDPAYSGTRGCREIVVGGDEWNQRIDGPDEKGLILTIAG